MLVSVCFDSINELGHNFKFSDDGNSHNFPCSVWFHYSKNIKFSKNGILLVDSGNDNDSIDPILEKFPNHTIIRMCIDDRSKSIVTQTCRYKAELKNFNFLGEDWEQREYYTLMYHHGENNPNYYINNFKPLENCVNINISDLFRNFDKVLTQLKTIFGSYDYNKACDVHKNFLEANKRYYAAEELVDIVKQALETNNHVDLNEYSLHDQGYLLFWLERQYNIKEIPPYDYKDWFQNTQEVQICINSIP